MLQVEKPARKGPPAPARKGPPAPARKTPPKPARKGPPAPARKGPPKPPPKAEPATEPASDDIDPDDELAMWDGAAAYILNLDIFELFCEFPANMCHDCH